MTPLRFDHFVLVAADVSATLGFYRRVLGAEVRDEEAWRARDAPYPVLHFGDWKINVHAASGEVDLVARAPTPGAVDACFVWPGPIEEARVHLESSGVEVVHGPIAQEGARGRAVSLYFRDPDGNLLEFISYDPGSVADAADPA